MKKTYPTEIILSLTTGVLLKAGGFGALHELAEHVAGHSIWTHEFAEKALWARLSEAVFLQHPSLRDAEPWGEQNEQNPSRYVARAIASFGTSLDIESGTGERTESPIESLRRVAPGKAVAVVAASSAVKPKDGRQ